MTATTLSQVEIDNLFAAMLQKSIEATRIPLTNEKVTQAHIATVLGHLDITHRREFRISKGNIVDFWLPDGDPVTTGTVIEVKMNAARPVDVLRQLIRYAEHPRVNRLFLIANKAIDLPSTLSGKPAYYISLGRAWL